MKKGTREAFSKMIRTACNQLPPEQQQALDTIAQAPMNVQAVIDYYEIVSAPKNAEKKFASHKSYETVARELTRGTFSPDRDSPENLASQNKCQNIYKDLADVRAEHPWCSEELISHTWNHDIFRAKM